MHKIKRRDSDSRTVRRFCHKVNGKMGNVGRLAEKWDSMYATVCMCVRERESEIESENREGEKAVWEGGRAGREEVLHFRTTTEACQLLLVGGRRGPPAISVTPGWRSHRRRRGAWCACMRVGWKDPPPSGSANRRWKTKSPTPSLTSSSSMRPRARCWSGTGGWEWCADLSSCWSWLTSSGKTHSSYCAADKI